MCNKTKLPFLIIICISLSIGITKSHAVLEGLGNKFYILFETNYVIPDSLDLIIKAEENDATGVVEVPGLTLSIPFSVTAGSSATISLPSILHELGNDIIKNDKGVHIISDVDIIVYGLNRQAYSTDGFLALPVNQLGTEYYALSRFGENSASKSQFAIIATENNTEVTITPSIEVLGHLANQSYSIQLEKFQTYQLQALGDLSGSEVVATNPIAVFAGNECDEIPGGYFGCSHLVEQMTPETAWGTSFLVYPLATRTNGDTIRIIAAENGTTFTYSIPVPVGAPLSMDKGQVAEFIATSSFAIASTPDKPIMVAQYSNSSHYDGVPGDIADPFMMLIRPTEELDGGYSFVSPDSGFNNHYVNIIVPDFALADVVLDGIPVDSSSFSQIGNSNFYGADLEVTAGEHSVICVFPIGVQAYGFGSYNSYGYLGGSTFEATGNTDEDGDGVLYPNDLCPNTPQGLIVKINGCLEGDYDNDGDVDGNDLEQFSQHFGTQP